MTRPYSLGRRQASVDRTAAAVLAAAREVVAERGERAAIGAIARRAGVSRVTVYNRFGSREGLLEAIAAPPARESDPIDLRGHFDVSCARWATDPALFRHLAGYDNGNEAARRLAERLAAADALRPGCSIREAEDVIAVLSSFAVFDRLHKNGRRSPAAVTDLLMRLAAGILA